MLTNEMFDPNLTYVFLYKLLPVNIFKMVAV